MEKIERLNPQTPEDMGEKAVIQIAIIRSMMRRKVIATELEYIDKGLAAAFEMFWSGAIRVAQDEEVDNFFDQAKKLFPS